ncbi:MAG: flagellar hook-length control protein FliK, partial [Actinobacteria bacterium]|nr:flagellar hook-length control protein FliK [Actinomycetota bacterium]
HIITSNTATMDDESLFAFARSQGMDESSLALIFQHTAPPSPTIEASAMADPSPLITLDVPYALGKQASAIQAALTDNALPATPLATSATVAPAAPLEPKTDADGMSVLDLGADGSLRWSVHQAGQLNAAETKKDTLALADASVKPVHQTGIELSTTAVQQQSKQAPAENLATTLILGASEAAQFAKRVQTKQVNLHTEKNAALTGESFKSSAAKIEPSSISAIDDTSAVADTLSLGTELTGEDLRMMWEHRQHSSANNNANSDSGMGSSTGQTNAPQSDIDLRADQYQKLSQRLGEALGQRLAAQIARGDWNVELTLKPQDLGNIEIKLDMKQGNLEASFNASEAMTRDLIVDGLPRLKETLTQSGMEVAQLSVSTRQDGQNGGNSTPGRQKTPNAISGVSKSSAVTTGEPTASLTAKK